MQISEYINKWLTILEEMNNDNTYKLAWGRAIIEICSDLKIDDIDNEKDVTITFEQIGKKMLKYYWNQLFYFNLRQSAVKGNTRLPKMVQYTTHLIEAYKKTFDTSKPEWFNKVYPSSDHSLNNQFKRFIKRDIPKTLSENVSIRFMNVKNKRVMNVYELNLDEKVISLELNHVTELKEYSQVLTQLFNYKWALLLEKYNYSPKIGNKVKGSGDEEIKRHNLQSYKKILLLQYGEDKVKDFYTGEEIDEDDISIDHVIPWSFVYDDDIWNLVITTKSNNSSKSNIMVSEDYIEKLEQRNKKLFQTLQIQEDNDSKKYLKDLQFAMENNTVKELYNYFRG